MKHHLIAGLLALILPGTASAEICFPSGTCDARGFVCKSDFDRVVGEKDQRYAALAQHCNDIIDDYNALADRSEAATQDQGQIDQLKRALQREAQFHAMAQTRAETLQYQLSRWTLCAEVSDSVAALQACVDG